MIDIQPYGRDAFRITPPGYGKVSLLFRVGEWNDLDSGVVWVKDGEEGNRYYAEGVAFKAGKEYILEAITIGCQDREGTNISSTLRVCNQVSIYFGDEELTCTLKNRIVESTYAYFEVYEDSVQTVPGKKVIFKKDVPVTYYKVDDGEQKHIFVEYQCGLGDKEGSIIMLYPTLGLAYENSDYNPLLSNVTSSVLSSFTRNVETSRITYSGSNGKAGTHYSYSYDRVTTPAEMVDSFYTSLQNISGRYLGAKNGLKTGYRGFKWEYSNENLSASMDEARYAEGDTKVRKRDLPFFHVQGFTGSIYPVGTEDAALKTISVSEMVLEKLYYTTTASFLGKTVTGSLDVDRSRVDQSHVTQTEVSAGVVRENNLPRVGTILYRIENSVERLTNVKIYSPDLGAALKTDGYGIVTDILSIQT